MFGRTYLISAIIYPRSELQCVLSEMKTQPENNLQEMMKRFNKAWNRMLRQEIKKKGSITPSHSRLFVTGSQKWATAMKRDDGITSKYSHIDWSAIACARSCEKSQWRTKRFDSTSTPVTTRLWMSVVSLSSWVWMYCWASCWMKSLK